VTAIENASGYVVVLSSVLQSRTVTLVSCYLADLGGPTGFRPQICEIQR
jgi:hypothetical protein